MTTKWMPGLALGIALLFSGPRSRAADIFISTNIQAAIDAASPGDVIHLAAGKYPELLAISKDLTLVGSGTNCVIYNYQTNYVALISITGPATVTLSHFQLIGGWYQSWYKASDWYDGFSSLGIVSTNAHLIMDSVVLNQIVNFYVTVAGGSLLATNVAVWTEDIANPCDVGFQLNSCVAVFDGLTQDAGHIDHTININNPPANFSDVTVVNSRIRASRADYGNCIRTYINSRLLVTNCYLYRGTDTNEEFISFNRSIMHNAISVSGYSNTVVIAGNTLANLPWGIQCYGSFGGDQVRVENNHLSNSIFGGVLIQAVNYPALDLGGGPFGSRGGNVFSESPAPTTNFCGDVFYTALSGACAANLFALHNTWSNPTNRESVIFDKLDQPTLGRLISDDLWLKAVGTGAGGRAAISWNERGAGEFYTVEMCGDLAGGHWSNAPGSWPILNPGSSDPCWTNPATVATNVFYRLRSLVP